MADPGYRAIWNDDYHASDGVRHWETLTPLSGPPTTVHHSDLDGLVGDDPVFNVTSGGAISAKYDRGLGAWLLVFTDAATNRNSLWMSVAAAPPPPPADRGWTIGAIGWGSDTAP